MAIYFQLSRGGAQRQHSIRGDCSYSTSCLVFVGVVLGCFCCSWLLVFLVAGVLDCWCCSWLLVSFLVVGVVLSCCCCSWLLVLLVVGVVLGCWCCPWLLVLLLVVGVVLGCWCCFLVVGVVLGCYCLLLMLLFVFVCVIQEPSNWQLFMFSVEVILVPHYIVGMCAWYWSSSHGFLCTAILIHCLWTTQREAKQVIAYISSRHAMHWRQEMMILGKGLLYNVVTCAGLVTLQCHLVASGPILLVQLLVTLDNLAHCIYIGMETSQTAHSQKNPTH